MERSRGTESVGATATEPMAADSGPTTAAPPVVSLADTRRAMARALAADRPTDAAKLAQMILKRMPRHLDTYQRLLQILWTIKDWPEGEEWGRRLLQADPNNAQAWRAVARGIEERGERAQSHAVWRRAFEVAPYDVDVRAGLGRTSLAGGADLTLDRAALATLYRFGYRWRHAAAEYRALVDANPRRIDFVVGLMVARWRMGEHADAYQIARHLAERHPHTIMAWVVMAATGDENDRALAHNPIRSMDADGTYARQWLRLSIAPSAEQAVARVLPGGQLSLTVTPAEAGLVEEMQKLAARGATASHA